jgi:hypothetical protein
MSFYGTLKNPVKYETYFSSAKFTTICCQVFSEFLLGVYAGIYQRALVDESGMMRTQMEMHNRSENACSASDSLYDATP